MASIRKRCDMYQLLISVGYDVHGMLIFKTKKTKTDGGWRGELIDREFKKSAVRI